MKRIATLAGLLAAVAAPAVAQTSNGGPSQSVAQPSVAPQPSAPEASAPMPAQTGVAPSDEHLFGDWGGLRTYLEEQGHLPVVRRPHGVRRQCQRRRQTGLDLRQPGSFHGRHRLAAPGRDSGTFHPRDHRQPLRCQRQHAVRRQPAAGAGDLRRGRQRGVAPGVRLCPGEIVRRSARPCRGPHERRERFRQFAALLQLHEQHAVRRPEGAAGRRHRAQCLSGRRLGRPRARSPDAGHLCRDRRL